MAKIERRSFLAATGALLAASFAAAQSPKGPLRIAVISPAGASTGPARWYYDTIRDELKQLGYVEGRDLIFEARWAENSPERFSSLVTEAVAMNPAVIVTHSSPAVAAFRRATTTIPIVFHSASYQVVQGFVASMARPGGNITGIVLHSGLNAKVMELCREGLPMVRRLALLIDDTVDGAKFQLESFNAAAKVLKFEPVIVNLSHVKDIERAFRELAERKAEALLIAVQNFNMTHRVRLVALALSAKLPTLSSAPGFAAIGGLFSYATEYLENIQRAAVLVDKILRGAKPGDLAIEQPTRFYLVVNLKIAKAIGVTLSPTILLRTDRVIE